MYLIHVFLLYYTYIQIDFIRNALRLNISIILLYLFMYYVVMYYFIFILYFYLYLKVSAMKPRYRHVSKSFHQANYYIQALNVLLRYNMTILDKLY